MEPGNVRAWMVLGLIGCEAATAAPPAFTKITGQPFNASGGSQAIAWGDANNDGWPDVFITLRSSGATTLYTNNTHGAFGKATGSVGANLVNPVGGTWADFENKGSLDLFISNNNGGNDSLLRNNGSGVFTPVTTGSIVSSGGNGNGCAWADYDRDGYVDLYVANSDGTNFLFHNNGNGTFTRITTGAMVVSTLNSQGCAWIDYDNDGYPDLFVTRWQSANLLFHNNRNGTFTKISTGAIATEGGTAAGYAWGDFDNDGLLDAFVSNGPGNSLHHNNGDGTFTKVPPPTGTESGSFLCANWVDFDNDGWLDLFVVDFQVGAICRMYRNNGDGTFTCAAGSDLLTEKGRWFASAWADINQDGFPDVIVSNVGVGNVLFRNDGNTNHWLTVHCLGRVSNRAAIGAKMRVRATIAGKTFWQMREISGGGNIGSQDQLDPMFGLGDAATVDTLRVEWPSGLVQELHNIAPNQILAVKEPARLEPMNNGQPVFKLVGGKNVSYNIERSTDLETWTTWLTLTNTFGQTNFTNDASIDIQAFRAVEP